MKVRVITTHMQRSTHGRNCLEDGGIDALALIDHAFHSLYLQALMSQLFGRPHVTDGCPNVFWLGT